MLLRWANALNRSLPAFAEAQRLLEGEDSIIGSVVRRAKHREKLETADRAKEDLQSRQFSSTRKLVRTPSSTRQTSQLDRSTAKSLILSLDNSFKTNT